MWIFWTVLAIVGIALVVGGVIIAVDGRRQRELQAQAKPELTPSAEPDTVEEPSEEEPAAPSVEPEPAPAAPEVVEPEVPALDEPEAPLSRWARLRRRLSSSNNALARALADLLSVDKIDADVWDDFETTLITSDLGVGPATELTDALRKQLAVDGVADPAKAREVLRAELLRLVDPGLDRSLNLTPANDGDPAAVAFDAVKAAAELEADVVIIDTAGRLHNKANLMDELGKVKRVIGKQAPVDEVLLVLDATTGQNGLQQARVFGEVVDVTGLVLTKLDGTAKGGIVVAVQRELGVPVKLVGLGEGPDDLAPFVAADFVNALLDG